MMKKLLQLMRYAVAAELTEAEYQTDCDHCVHRGATDRCTLSGAMCDCGCDTCEGPCPCSACEAGASGNGVGWTRKRMS